MPVTSIASNWYIYKHLGIIRKIEPSLQVDNTAQHQIKSLLALVLEFSTNKTVACVSTEVKDFLSKSLEGYDIKTLEELPEGAQVDVVLIDVFNESFNKAKPVLKKGGTLILNQFSLEGYLKSEPDEKPNVAAEIVKKNDNRDWVTIERTGLIFTVVNE